MNALLSARFWSYAGERVIKTAAQTLIATVGTTALITDVEWAAVGSIVALAAVMSLATSLSGDWKTPAAVKEVAEDVRTEARPFASSTPRARIDELLNQKKGR